MKILVTGGAGFIGSAVIRHIINNTQHSVVNLDKLTYAGNLLSLKEVEASERYQFFKGDIADRTLVERIFTETQPDALMHLAAESHVDRSIDSPDDFIKTNIVGTYVLLECTRAYLHSLSPDRASRFRFHHVSTDEVYGDLEEGELFTENTPYNPSSPYSASKASSDHLVRAWHRTFGIPMVLTNCSNNYGLYHFPEKLIPLVILNAIDGKKLPIYGDGSQIRDWLYVEDHARALTKVIESGTLGQTYNIGGYNEKSNLDVVKTICKILDEIHPVATNETLKLAGSAVTPNRYSDLITFVKDRPGHDLRYAIDASKITDELGWVPQETFESGIRKTVIWFLQNLEWANAVQQDNYQRQRLGH